MNSTPTHEPRGYRSRRMSVTAVRIFRRIAEAWALSDVEQVDFLALDNLDALERLRHSPIYPLPRDTLVRISLMMKMYRALHTVLPVATAANGWVKRPNTNHIFGGKPALDLMTTRDLADLTRAQQYLDAQLL